MAETSETFDDVLIEGDQVALIPDEVLGEVDEANYLQFLTPEREPLPDDSYGEVLPEGDEDRTEEELLVGRDDFDDDEDDLVVDDEGEDDEDGGDGVEEEEDPGL